MQKPVKTMSAALLVGALGVVFGDIGTSPLYVMNVIFGSSGHGLPISSRTVLGVISLVIWTITIVVSLQYVWAVMRADNKGEGGVMALVAQLKGARLGSRTKLALIFIGLVGVALFYGDCAITPAISVLSAVEGLEVTQPHLSALVVPLTVAILLGLFWMQRYGTAAIGRLFGPVMLVWFLVIAIAGAMQIVHHPAVWAALLPSSAVHFIAAEPLAAFVTMGAVVLAVTGAEALFADMGHFGRPPIARTWFFVVFPALALCYMGQGAVLLNNSEAAANPFFFLFPSVLHVPIILLAAAATLIASQAVISGAFSLTRQAVQLGFLPHLTVRHTSDRETGQIYVPVVNFMLLAAVLLFVLLFGSSVRLANAYGIAVSGAIVVDALLFAALVWAVRQRFSRAMLLPAAVFIIVDMIVVAANFGKVAHGGWLPLLVAAGVYLLIDTWRKGEAIISHERKAMEGLLPKYIDELHQHTPRHLVRVPGEAVYISHHPGMAPLALHAAVENMHELQEKVVILYVKMTDEAHVPEHERATVDSLHYDDGISQVTLTYGFHDMPNIPHALEALRKVSSELNFNPLHAAYFISLTTVLPTRRHNMARWRKSLYALMARNSLSTTNYYKLPLNSTEEVHTLVPL